MTLSKKRRRFEEIKTKALEDKAIIRLVLRRRNASGRSSNKNTVDGDTRYVQLNRS